MQLVAPETGQSLQLIHMDEVRPLRGGIFMPDITEEIVRRYRFQSSPTQVVHNQPAKFEIGVRKINDITIPIASLEIYSDGIIVNTRNTDDSDLVIGDFIRWIAENFEFREPRTWLPRRYFSRIIV